MMKVLAVLVLVVVGVYCEETCLRACQLINDPVCATYTKTYGNECMMKADACEMAKKGFSLVKKPAAGECSCLRACTFIYKPVCANDGNTYNSECLMGSESCKQGKFLEVVHEGECNKAE
ncbi:hypothetical protein SNE40_018844 [Patella caerulea]|uniref:Kazal-like domain-containing protein n=1 Tax=Patella caerulea TaxID=87958 RepID=A0AAN8PDF6_PATCE